MKLDPEIAAMLDTARAHPGGGVGDLPLEEGRAAYRQRYLARGIVPDREIATSDHAVPVAGGGIRGRLYRAPGNHRNRPITLYFHGGGFMLGDIEAYDNQSRMLAALSGIDVFLVDYRLAPEHKFPVAIGDAAAALKWVAEHSGDLDIDPARIALAGDSAGGNLAINTVLQARAGGGPAVAAQVLLYPVTDFRPFAGGESYASIEAFGDGFFLDTRLMEHFARAYLRDDADAFDLCASPLMTKDLSGLPKTVVVTAGHDPLRDMGRAFFEALASAGTSARYECMEGMVHNFMGHAGISSGARAAFERVAALLSEAMN